MKVVIGKLEVGETEVGKMGRNSQLHSFFFYSQLYRVFFFFFF